MSLNAYFRVSGRAILRQIYSFARDLVELMGLSNLSLASMLKLKPALNQAGGLF